MAPNPLNSSYMEQMALKGLSTPLVGVMDWSIHLTMITNSDVLRTMTDDHRTTTSSVTATDARPLRSRSACVSVVLLESTDLLAPPAGPPDLAALPTGTIFPGVSLPSTRRRRRDDTVAAQCPAMHARPVTDRRTDGRTDIQTDRRAPRRQCDFR